MTTLELQRELEVATGPAKAGEPTALFGGKEILCASRHGTSMACADKPYLPLRYDGPGAGPRLDSDGWPMDFELPVALADFAFVDMATNLAERCVLTDDQALFCWGGLMPDGRPVDRPERLPIATHAKAISVGLQTCAVDLEGRVRCMGPDMCQDYRERPRNPIVFSPVDVPPAVDVAAGGSLACSTTEEGDVYCWGMIGEGVTCVEKPVKISGVSRAVALVSEHKTACALTATNEVRCWGDNLSFFLADPDLHLFSTDAVKIPNVTPAVQVEAAYTGIAALKADGTIWYWGFDATKDNEDKSPIQVAGIENAIDLVMDDEYGCALLADHSIRCFGPRIDRRHEYPDKSPRPLFESKEAWVNAPTLRIRDVSAGGAK